MSVRSVEKSPIDISLCADTTGFILVFENIWNNSNCRLEKTFVDTLCSEIDIVQPLQIYPDLILVFVTGIGCQRVCWRPEDKIIIEQGSTNTKGYFKYLRPLPRCGWTRGSFVIAIIEIFECRILGWNVGNIEFYSAIGQSWILIEFDLNLKQYRNSSCYGNIEFCMYNLLTWNEISSTINLGKHYKARIVSSFGSALNIAFDRNCVCSCEAPKITW